MGGTVAQAASASGKVVDVGGSIIDAGKWSTYQKLALVIGGPSP